MLDAIRVDWEQRYGIVPQRVETFVVRSGSWLPTGYPRSGLANTGASTSHHQLSAAARMYSSPRSLILLVLLESAGGHVLWGAPDDLRPSQPVRSEVAVKKVHWAFVTPQAVSVPAVTNQAAVRNLVDRFILSRLEQEGVAPAPEANRMTLLRRVHLDVTGLPPTPDETARFLADLRPDAYERRVDDLLASPHYGERWARWWLDVARYADSNGYSIDAPRSIWPWRDWVIRAFNEDLPYDQFLIEQLAGDLLPNATPAQHVATGFHRNTQINEEGGIDREQFRIESVMDRVNTTGTAFLGITIGCAQCHDHKFDPLSQRDYFQLYAFFNQQEEPNFELIGQPASASELHSQLREAEAEFDRYSGTVGGALANWEKALPSEIRTALPTAARTALETVNQQRTRAQKRILFTASNLQDSGYRQREQRLADLEAGRNAWVSTLVLEERKERRPSFIFIKGDFTRRGADVTPNTPAVLPALHSEPGHIPNRLDLARWLVAPENPLTARVVVNRIWQQYFGRGLVETENDFGTQGALPTHPELLDWLASALRIGTEVTGSQLSKALEPWHLKPIHRLIVTSATYRQASTARPELALVDPLNRLRARQSRLRLDAEVIRDVALAASGKLELRIGGPSVFPPQPDGVMALGQSRRDWTAATGADRYRRGLYTWWWRATPHPALAVFDAPDAFTTCTRRLRSNTPLQALTLLNDSAFVELARALAERVQREAAPENRLDRAFRLCLTRPPHPPERERLQKLWDEERRDHNEASAWFSVARVLLNLDETITRE